MILNLVSVRVGSKYGPEYVGILHDQLARNLSTWEGEIRHWSLTDDPMSLPEGVVPIPHNPDLPGWWQKVFLFSPDMPWGEGERILYMDLDSAITGRLEDLAQTKGIFRDKFWPMFSSAIMVWDHGEHRRVWEGFAPEMMTAPGPFPELYPKTSPNGGDQEVITALDPDWNLLPEQWARSYVDAAVWPPEGCKVVMFHGEKNKPHLMPADSWVHDVWKVGGFTSLPEMKGMNVTHDEALANVRDNCKWPIDWFTGCPEHSKTMVLVCGGPSMKANVKEIRDHQRRGAIVVTVNNAMRFLLSKGIKPDRHVILDARPDNIDFLKDAPEGIRYLLASQCHPSLFELLLHEKGKHDVILWHNRIGDGDELIDVVDGYYKANQAAPRPIIQVPGGCTVGLRSLWLAAGSGFRRIHVYGLDSSYSGDEHHAYEQALNDGENTLRIVMNGREFRCATWMARQANDFQNTYVELRREGVQVWVHGQGLIPTMWRLLREREFA